MRGTVRTAETRTSQKGRTYYAFTLEGGNTEYTCFDRVNQGDEIEFDEEIKGEYHNARKVRKINASKATQAGLEPQCNHNQIELIAVCQSCNKQLTISVSGR